MRTIDKCFLNSLECTKIAAVEAPPQTTLGELTAIQISMMYIHICWERKNGFEICEFIGRVGGLPGCVSDLITGNNLAYFVCFAFIKNFLFLNNRSVEK